MTSRFTHPIDVPPSFDGVDLSPLLRQMIDQQAKTADALAALGQAVQALTRTAMAPVSPAVASRPTVPYEVRVAGVARDETLQEVVAALEHAASSGLLLPDVLDVKVTDPVALDEATITAMRALIGEVRANTATGKTVIASGASGGSKIPDLTGTWNYAAGTDGTLNLTGGKRVLTVTASSTAGGTVTVDGGDAIVIPANGEITIEPQVQMVDPTLVFTGTSAYYVDWLTG